MSTRVRSVWAIAVTCVFFLGMQRAEAATLVLKSDPFSVADGQSFALLVSNLSDFSIAYADTWITSDDAFTGGTLELGPGETNTNSGFFKILEGRVTYRVELVIDAPAARKGAEIGGKVRALIEFHDSEGRVQYSVPFRE